MMVWFNESPSALAAAIWRRNYSSCAFIFTTSRLIQDSTTLSAEKIIFGSLTSLRIKRKILNENRMYKNTRQSFVIKNNRVTNNYYYSIINIDI